MWPGCRAVLSCPGRSSLALLERLQQRVVVGITVLVDARPAVVIVVFAAVARAPIALDLALELAECTHMGVVLSGRQCCHPAQCPSSCRSTSLYSQPWRTSMASSTTQIVQKLADQRWVQASATLPGFI